MAKPEHWRGKTPVRCIKTAFFLNWVEHAILEVHSHSNRSQNFASFSKNPPEKKSCRKRSVKKLFISSLKKKLIRGQKKIFYLVNIHISVYQRGVGIRSIQSLTSTVIPYSWINSSSRFLYIPEGRRTPFCPSLKRSSQSSGFKTFNLAFLLSS